MPVKKLIQRVTIGSGGAASITFSSIPQTYTDLYVVLSLRNDRGSSDGDARYCGIAVNGSSANTSQRLLQGNGSAVASYAYAAGSLSYPFYFYITGTDYTASTFSNASIYISNYANGSAKSLSMDSVTENNATRAFQSIHAGFYNSTSAITSLSVVSLDSNAAAAGNFVQYSTASLYGITRGSDGVTTVS